MDRLKPLIAAILFLVSGWAGGPAAARTVGLVFDDSGSMGPSIQLPAFGVQLLVSTLDGRDGHDRLFAMKLSDTSVTKFDLRTQDRIGFAINQIRQGWTTVDGGTPYQPVALMLDTLVRETSDGEKAYLVVVTDGGFNGNVPTPDALRVSYQALKQKMKGQLKVLFLFIDRGTGERNTAEQQKVYTTLLDVLGGDKDDDVRFVTNAAQLKEAMVHFVAKISETDLDRNNSVMRRSGNAIELNLPFSVTRIISLGIDPDRSPPPHVVGRDFQAEALEFQPSMAKADTYFPTRLIGNVTQLRMEPALGTGSHRVEFSGPVGDETVLLFRSEIGLRWRLFDGTREVSAVPPAPITATQGRKYKIVVQVQDRVAGADVVLPSKIPDAVVTATIISPSGSIRALTLKSSDIDKGFIADVTFDAEGKYEIRTGLRLPGFVTDRIDPVFVNVVARALDLTMRLVRAEACPVPTDCPDGALPARVRPANEPAGPVGYIDVTGTPPPQRSGQFRLEIANLETGFEVVGPDGQPVRPNSLYTVSAGQKIRFGIVRPANWRPALGTTAVPAQTTVKAVAAQPLEGEATVAFRIQPNMPDPILRYRGHDQDRDGLRPLTLELPGSEQGRQAFDFYVENTLELPTAANISTSFSSGMIGALTKAAIQIPRPGSDGASGYAFSVHPKLSWWCQCFVGLALLAGISPDATVKVTYDPRDGRPAASAEAPLRFTTEGWHVLSLWSGCLWLLIAILLIAYILRVVYALLAAQRFPRSARFYVFDVGQTEPLAKRVRNSFWSDLRWALVTRVPRHHYRLDSLIVEADAGQQLRMRTATHEWPGYYSAKHGRLLQEVAEQMVKRHQAVRAADAVIPMSWESLIDDPMPGGRRIVFVRNFARRPDTAVTRELTA